MAYLDVDFVAPISLLVASLIGVMLVRLAAARGERLAKERTRRLIERFTSGMREEDRASTDCER